MSDVTSVQNPGTSAGGGIVMVSPPARPTAKADDRVRLSVSATLSLRGPVR
jgi:hypothetical protein